MKKSTTLPHRNRSKTVRFRAAKKAKLQRARKRMSRGGRKTYR
jgi:hypothetical protein